MSIAANNPNWPLPAEYGELSADGQRQARLHVLTYYRTPGLKTKQISFWFKVAWDFFRTWYLKPEGEDFYKGGFRASPSWHYDVVGDIQEFLFNIQGHPRGGGKSVIGAAELPLMLALTRPNFVTCICSSTQGLIPEKVTKIKLQVVENKRILADFGTMRPRGRSDLRPFNDKILHLMNNSEIHFVSLGQRQRGKRPMLYILDDPEYDGKNTIERKEVLRQEMEDHMQKIVIGMLPENCGILWLGTMLGKRSYLYHACFTKDKDFQSWNKRVVSGAKLDRATGNVVESCWPANWSVEFLQFKKDTMGLNFMSEIMNNPVSETDRLLSCEPVRNEYTFDLLPPNKDDREAPHLPHPDALMTYYYNKGFNTMTGKQRWQKDTVKAKDYFDNLYKILLFDYAGTVTASADYSCILILGFDARNTAWCLDSWLGKMQDNGLMSMVMRYGEAWDCTYIGLESAGAQIKLAKQAELMLDQRQDTGLSSIEWQPRIRPIKYPGNPQKGFLIAYLKPDFEQGKIKLPGSLKHMWPWKAAYVQIKDFTISLEHLRKDDWIDTLAMKNYAKHGKGDAKPTRGLDPNQEKVDALKAGKPVVPGYDSCQGLGIDEISEEMLDVIAAKQYAQGEYERNEDANVWPDTVVVG